MLELTDPEFDNLQRFIYERAGITMTRAKKALISGRLAKRLAARGLTSYTAYHTMLTSGQDHEETQLAIDLLTTNETYFFREPRHFEHLAGVAAARTRRAAPMRVWSAASSSGEEAYTIAMVLADRLEGQAFEVIGTDISTRVLERARTGHYAEARMRNIPVAYLKRYCLKGGGNYAGTMLVERAIRQRVRFMHANLNDTLPTGLGMFDAVFLRNVMIYFNGATKQQVVARALSLLQPGGFLYIGHSESLHGMDVSVQPVAPSIYLKAD